MGSLTYNRSPPPSPAFDLTTRVVVGAGAVKTQLGGVQETRKSTPPLHHIASQFFLAIQVSLEWAF